MLYSILHGVLGGVGDTVNFNASFLEAPALNANDYWFWMSATNELVEVKQSGGATTIALSGSAGLLSPGGIDTSGDRITGVGFEIDFVSGYFDQTQDLSIDLWVRVTTSGAGSQNNRSVFTTVTETTSGSAGGVAVRALDADATITDNKWRPSINVLNASGSGIFTANTSAGAPLFTQNAWTHIAVEYNVSAQSYRLWMSGTVLFSGVCSSTRMISGTGKLYLHDTHTTAGGEPANLENMWGVRYMVGDLRFWHLGTTFDEYSAETIGYSATLPS